MQQAYLVKTDGSKIAINPLNGTDFNFLEIRRHLGDVHFEIVYLPNNQILIVDESGALKDNRVKNDFATNLYTSTRISKEEYEKQNQEWRNQGFEVFELQSYDDFAIYGDAIICDSSMVK